MLQATGFSEWMIWNPGQVGASQISDLPDHDWQNFVCVEPVFASKPAVLAKGERFEGTLKAMWLT